MILKKLERLHQVFRNTVIKGFELSLEVVGKLLRKALKTCAGDPKAIEQLSYKAVFRHAAKRGLVTTEQVRRWFNYRDNRNSTAHDYGEAFAEQTLTMLADFINDARALQQKLQQCFEQSDA